MYAADPHPAAPFPAPDHSHPIPHRHVRFTERVVHQIHFKIFTHSNDERELFIEEIPTTGISKSRDPEHFFYGLSGNWEWSKQTADYWRHHFEIPLLHGNNPFRNVVIETAPPSGEEGHLTTISTLARQEGIIVGCQGIRGTWRPMENGGTHELHRRDPSPAGSFKLNL